MKIGLDFDGVISNCGKLKQEAAKKLYGVDISIAQFFKKNVIEKGLLTAKQYRELQKNIYGTRELGFLMEPVDGTLFWLPKLIEDGHTVLVITSRGKIETEIAKEWSLSQGLSLEFVSVGYNNSKEKAVAGLDVYADDGFDKIEELIGIVPNLFLFSWSYNRHINEGNVAERVYLWEELYRKIKAL